MFNTQNYNRNEEAANGTVGVVSQSYRNVGMGNAKNAS